MIISPPSVNFLKFFGFEIHYYSICLFLSVFLCSILAYIISKKKFGTEFAEKLLDFLPLLVVFSIIGARAYYVLLTLDYFKNHILEVFKVWHGGLSIHGAFFGGLIFGAVYLKKKKLPFLKYADIITAVLPLGQAIGRFGNFFNSEAFGVPVINSPLKLFVPLEFRPIEFKSVEYFHPVFLYESVLNLILFILLYYLINKTAKNFDGLVFFIYIFSYSLIRLFLEFLRLDSALFLFNLPFPAIVSIVGILVGLIGIIFKSRKAI